MKVIKKSKVVKVLENMNFSYASKCFDSDVKVDEIDSHFLEIWLRKYFMSGVEAHRAFEKVKNTSDLSLVF